MDYGLSPDELSRVARWFLDDCEDIRAGIEQRWHLLHVICGRNKIQGVLQMLTQGALSGSSDLKEWFYSAMVSSPASSSLPPQISSAPLEEKLWSRCRNEMGYEMDALLKLRHDPAGINWSLTVESTSESLLGCVSTVLFSSDRHPEMTMHEALLQAFRTFRISAMQLERLTMRRALTETKSRVAVDFWRSLWRAARSGGCGARHLVDWRHPGRDNQKRRLRRTDWPIEHLCVSQPSGNVELRVERKFGASAPPEADWVFSPSTETALADKHFREAVSLRFKQYTTALRIFGFYRQAHDLGSGTTRQRWAAREMGRLSSEYQAHKQELAGLREKCVADFAQLELPEHDGVRLLKALETPPIDEFVGVIDGHKPELLQQWLDRLGRMRTPLTMEGPFCIVNPQYDEFGPIASPASPPEESLD
jgi:hypothetical protein